MQKISRALLIVLYLAVSMSITSCGGGSDVVPEQNTVIPLYNLNGANWNDYVSDDGPDMFSASDSSCNPDTDSSCLHGGQIMTMEVPDQASCVDLSVDDNLSVFEWVCDDSASPVRFISTGFKPGKGLSDLIDFETVEFRENYLTVQEAGVPIFRSKPETWWRNGVFENNDGSNGRDMKPGQIHIITQTADAAYTIGVDRVALLVKPGVILVANTAGYQIPAAVSAANRKYVWVEGTIDATDCSEAIDFVQTDFSTIYNVNVFNADGIGVALHSSSNNTLNNVIASDNSTGITLGYSSNNILSNVTSSSNKFRGFFLYDSSDNTLTDITASNNGVDGILLNSNSDTYPSSNNTLTNVTVSNNKEVGILLKASSNITLSNISAIENYGRGISLDSTTGSTLSDISVSNNTSYGVHLSYSLNNTLSNITSSGNAYGVHLSYSLNNTLSNITSSGNAYGVHLSHSLNNTLSNITVSNNNSYGVSLVASSSNNELSNITASNSDIGVYLFATSNDNTLSNITASDSTNGIYLRSSSNNTLSNITASNNDYGVNLFVSSEDRFTGELQVGSNMMSDCLVYSGTNPGLVDGSCANSGSSDATLATGVSVSNSFVDAASDNYSLLSTDTVIRNILAVPNGTYTNTHIWSDLSTTAMLRNAVEIQGDGIGNDNLLCESNEVCLYTPNIAAYQGHGNLVSAGTFSDGTITGVTLMRYEINGY